MVQAGDDLAALLLAAMARAGLAPEPGDVLAIAQKIVSKAEGRSIALASVQPSAAAEKLKAAATTKANFFIVIEHSFCDGLRTKF